MLGPMLKICLKFMTSLASLFSLL